MSGLQQARERYELSEAAMSFWTREFEVTPEGTPAKRAVFLFLDIATTRREQALAALWRAMDERQVTP